MKILSNSQIQEADRLTIIHEPISSIDLMERAAKALFDHLKSRFHPSKVFCIYCGKGNNGGDGLALARMLDDAGFETQVHIVEHSSKSSDEFSINYERLRECNVAVRHIHKIGDWIKPHHEQVLLDAMLGSGLSRPLAGLIEEVVGRLNQSDNLKVAIDIPTGLFADSNAENDLTKVLAADLTLSLEFPKYSMTHILTAPLCGELQIVKIGLDENYINSISTAYQWLTKDEIKTLFKPRKKFTYKGSYGHVLLMAGSLGSTGAAMMSIKACLRAGAGLLSVAAPGCSLIPIQSGIPEAMVIPDQDESKLTNFPKLKGYTAIGIGPGIGQDAQTCQMLDDLLQSTDLPMVIDADALNIISQRQQLLNYLPAGSILTPHIGEFRRLLGVESLDHDYHQALKDFSQKHQVVVVLKDAISAIATPEGDCFFMDFGSPALASPGSGDVLAGVILALLGSGYSAEHSAILGSYLQARAGTLAGEELSLESTLASDVIDRLPQVFREFY